MLNNLFKKKITEKEFWSWFEKNSEGYFQLDENNYDLLFNKLGLQLSKYHKDLTFEFSVEMNQGKREFIISAEGMVSAFPAVIKLVEEAPCPCLEKFNIVAFRQRQNSEQEIYFEDIVLNTKDIFFTYREDKEMNCLDIVIYIKGYTEENDQFIGAAFIMLDSLIGEYDVGVKLGEINFEPYQGEKEAQSILNLVSLVDKI
ncbi:hypothetical protein [Priestia megaterium]|uniref:hypothetical protein n=1 Tax=Priestia megaterium TaxID=1404 RepID=UPI000BF57856|nr:hypothetical protein [Priestia megaterium]MDP1443257.1 hypothetical protein [Priestia megaterium]MDP1472410.1 hypothetical protein [Priestia megaterium]PFK65057.1 hypothetical protein COJ21_24895 [Priestia megaterium]